MKSQNRRKSPQKRTHLVAKIGAESNFHRKLEMALGRSIFLTGEGSGKPETAEDISEIVKRVQALGSRMMNDATDLDPEIDQEFEEVICFLGRYVMRAIHRGDARFFQLMSGALLSTSSCLPNKLYAVVINYCCERHIRTIEKPCDGSELTAFLRHLGFYKNAGNYSHEVPRALRTLCGKLGIILSKGKRGRRPSNRHP